MTGAPSFLPYFLTHVNKTLFFSKTKWNLCGLSANKCYRTQLIDLKLKLN